MQLRPKHITSCQLLKRISFSFFHDFHAINNFLLEKDRLKALLFSEEYGGSQYRNILHVAVNSGNESLVEVCLQQDEKIIRSCLSEEIKNNTHLIHDVCKYGMEKLLSRFVSMMGDLDLMLLNRKDERGHTPLHRYCHRYL